MKRLDLRLDDAEHAAIKAAAARSRQSMTQYVLARALSETGEVHTKAAAPEVVENVRPAPSHGQEDAELVQGPAKPDGWVYWSATKRKNWLTRNGLD